MKRQSQVFSIKHALLGREEPSPKALQASPLIKSNSLAITQKPSSTRSRFFWLFSLCEEKSLSEHFSRPSLVAFSRFFILLLFVFLCHREVAAQDGCHLSQKPTIKKDRTHKNGWNINSRTVVAENVKITVSGTLIVNKLLINYGTIEVIKTKVVGGKPLPGVLRGKGTICNYGRIIVEGNATIHKLNNYRAGVFGVTDTLRNVGPASHRNKGITNRGVITAKNFINEGDYSDTPPAQLLVKINFHNTGVAFINGRVSVFRTLTNNRLFMVEPSGRLVVKHLWNITPKEAEYLAFFRIFSKALVRVKGILKNDGADFYINGSASSHIAPNQKGGLSVDGKIINQDRTGLRSVSPDLGLCQFKKPIKTGCPISPGAESRNRLAARLEFLPLTTPVELLFFRPSYAESVVKLEWKTASERNNDYFNLYRATSENVFEKIKVIKGHGTTQVPRYYHVADLPPAAGLYYYQLEQVDYDGTSERFDVIRVKWYADEVVRQKPVFYPSPVRAGQPVFADLRLPKDGLIKVSVTSISGKTEMLDVEPSVSHLTIDATHLPRGIYLFCLTTPKAQYQQKIPIR